MTGNPTLNQRTFTDVTPAYADVSTGGRSEVMTIGGTVQKTGILLGLLILSASYTWNAYYSNPNSSMAGWAMIGGIGGFVIAMVTVFKMAWSPVTAPLYAICEGLFVGAISAIFESRYQVSVIQAVLLTFGTLAALLAAYQTGIIRASAPFKRGVIAATGGIAIAYFISIILGLFHIQIPFIAGSGPLGIGFSIFCVVIAAMNLVIDFDFIEQGAKAGAPKYMEWYASFSLLVTLVWLYLEILRLLSKLSRRD